MKTEVLESKELDTLIELIEEYNKLEIKYEEIFGEGSLERTLIIDPLHIDENSLKEGIKIISKAINNNKRIAQISEDMWNKLIF